MEKKTPLGVKILGVFNLVIQGAVVLLAFLFVYFNLTQEVIEQVEQVFFGGQRLGLDAQGMRARLLPVAPIAIFFIVTGYGLLVRKEWARRATNGEEPEGEPPHDGR